MSRLLLAAALFAVSALAPAQLRLDADVRLGRSNMKYWEGLPTIVFETRGYDGLFSVGADARVGYELPLGFGLYSGVNYDLIRTNAVRPTTFIQGGGALSHKGWAHNFHFLTVPLLAEYRLLRDVVRPYGGIGAAFLLGTPNNHLDRNYARWRRERDGVEVFYYRRVTPSLLFGLNLEYRRMILGLAVRRDLVPFWEGRSGYNMTWKARQVAARLGFRIF